MGGVPGPHGVTPPDPPVASGTVARPAPIIPRNFRRPREGSLRATRTGIGTALREARESRGITLQKASRETRIHSDYLTALERECYDTLRADVYVRGFLRSYSSYLGLDVDKVLTVYDRRAPSAPPPSPDPVPDLTKR